MKKSKPKPKTQTLYMVLRFSRWSKVSVRGFGPLDETMDDGSIGMVPVFATREEAEAAANGAQVIAIREHQENPAPVNGEDHD